MDFTYDANIKLRTEETPSDEFEYQILEMSALSPMACHWQRRDGEEGRIRVFLDFYNERVYDKHLSQMDTSRGLGLALLQVLISKKSEALLPQLPDELIDRIFAERKTTESVPSEADIMPPNSYEEEIENAGEN